MDRDSVDRLSELKKLCGNDSCADCGRKDPDYAAYNLGIFICEPCAKIHNELGCHVSRVKSIESDRWEEDQLRMMTVNGNEKSRLHFEEHVPLCYRRPKPNDPRVIIEQWIRGKYERLDFVNSESMARYTNGYKEGYLWKKGKNGRRFARRRFVLNENLNLLTYYIRDEARVPKAKLMLNQLTMIIAPEKIGNPNGMQIISTENNTLRNIFVYAESGQELIEWYSCLRSAKLNRLSVAFPNLKQAELCVQLTRDTVREGWLHKTGPRPNDSYRRRWVVLDDHKLHYSEDPLDPFLKGSVTLGSKEKGYAVRENVPPKVKVFGSTFTLFTPNRNYYLSATTDDERTGWINALQSVIRNLS